jgi:hypothetical protein
LSIVWGFPSIIQDEKWLLRKEHAPISWATGHSQTQNKPQSVNYTLIKTNLVFLFFETEKTNCVW